MISEIGCRGYRAFEQAVVPFGKLTVVFGKNNSGKTTLTRLPLLIGEALRRNAPYVLEAKETRFGASFRDLTNIAAPHPSLSYWVSTVSGGHWEIDLRLVTRELEEHVSVERMVVDGITWESSSAAPSESSADAQSISTELEARNPLEPSESVVAELGKIVHVRSARPTLLPVYEARPPADFSVDEAPYLLYAEPAILRVVSDWFSVHFDGLLVDVEHNDYSFRLTVGRTPYESNLASAGRGIQALLPVITLLKAVNLGYVKPGLVVVEEPEVHLHPAAHSAIAEILAESSTHVQVLTETHSENLILRLRTKVARGEILPSDVSLAFVDDDRSVVRINIDEHGGVRDWPAGVFESDVEEARAIVEARLKASGGVS